MPCTMASTVALSGFGNCLTLAALVTVKNRLTSSQWPSLQPVSKNAFLLRRKLGSPRESESISANLWPPSIFWVFFTPSVVFNYN